MLTDLHRKFLHPSGKKHKGEITLYILLHVFRFAGVWDGRSHLPPRRELAYEEHTEDQKTKKWTKPGSLMMLLRC